MSNASLVNGHIDRPKLTDKQIVQALECCIKHTKCMECSNLGNVDCMTKVMQNSLDLINRLKAQNKEFDEKIVIQRGAIDWQAKEINRQKAEIEKLENIERIATKTIETQKAEIEKKDIEIDILIRKNETLKDEIAELKAVT